MRTATALTSRSHAAIAREDDSFGHLNSLSKNFYVISGFEITADMMKIHCTISRREDENIRNFGSIHLLTLHQ